MNKIFLMFFAVAVLSGCSGLKPPAPVPSYSLAPGARVGVFVQIRKNPTHTHIGTTVFNNFSNSMPYEWDLHEQVERVLVSGLKSKNLEVINLRDEGKLSAADLSSLIVARDDLWVPGVGKESIVSKLRDMDLAAVVFVRETESLAALECAGGPCSVFMTPGHGLFTRSFMGLTRRYAVAAFETNLYVLDTYVDVATCQEMQQLDNEKSVAIDSFPYQDFKNLSASELQPVYAAILAHMKKLSDEAVRVLGNGCSESA